MVGTRSNSRQVTPIGTEDWGSRLRNSVRRSTATPAPTTRFPDRLSTDAPKAGSGARTGNASHAYGFGSSAAASRNISRHQRSAFTSAFQNEIDDQEPGLPALNSVGEETPTPKAKPEDTRSSPRDESPAPSVNSYTETTLPTLPMVQKSFSQGREQGVSNTVPSQRKNYAQVLEHGISNGERPTVTQRISSPITRTWHSAKSFFQTYRAAIYRVLLLLTLGALLYYSIPFASFRFSTSYEVSTGTPNANHGPSVITETVISYTQQPSDGTLPSHISRLESRIAALESSNAQLRLESRSSQPYESLFNHFSDVIGATVIASITSPTKSRVSGFIGLLTKFWTPPGARLPISALQAWSEPGDCWCTPADKGALAVRTPYPVNAGALTIEHVLERDLQSSGADLSTAPTSVDVWARARTPALYDFPHGACEHAPPQARGWTCLGRLDFDHRGQDARSLTVELTIKSVVATDFVILVNRNAGNSEATCLYRVMLHGNRQM